MRPACSRSSPKSRHAFGHRDSLCPSLWDSALCFLRVCIYLSRSTDYRTKLTDKVVRIAPAIQCPYSKTLPLASLHPKPTSPLLRAKSVRARARSQTTRNHPKAQSPPALFKIADPQLLPLPCLAFSLEHRIRALACDLLSFLLLPPDQRCYLPRWPCTVCLSFPGKL